MTAPRPIDFQLDLKGWARTHVSCTVHCSLTAAPEQLPPNNLIYVSRQRVLQEAFGSPDCSSAPHNAAAGILFETEAVPLAGTLALVKAGRGGDVMVGSACVEKAWNGGDSKSRVQ